MLRCKLSVAVATYCRTCYASYMISMALIQTYDIVTFCAENIRHPQTPALAGRRSPET